MKKYWPALLIVIFLLSGCSAAPYADSPYLGTWHATTGAMNGISVDIDDIDGNFELQFDKDGSVVAVTGDKKAEGKWQPTENGVDLQSGNETLHFTKDKEGHLSGTVQGVTLTFEKNQRKK